MAASAGHVAIRVKDVAKSLDFYINRLGFEEMMRLERDGKLWLVYLRVSDGQFLEIFPASEDGPTVPHETVEDDHMRFAVPDIDQCVREIEAAGIPLFRSRVRHAESLGQCWIRDPDEHPIELMQMAQESLRDAAIARLRTN